MTQLHIISIILLIAFHYIALLRNDDSFFLPSFLRSMRLHGVVEKESCLLLQGEKGIFGNRFDVESFINPVTVHDNKFTEIQIPVNYKAFY